MRLRLAHVVATVAAMAVAGCGGAPGSAPAGSPNGTPVPSTQPPTRPSTRPPTRPPTEPAAGTLVTYQRQGGIAGVNDRLTVWSDGSFVASRRGASPTRGMLAPGDLAALNDVLRHSGFADIPSVNSGDVVADGFTYIVGYAGHAVMAQDGAVPDALRPVLAALDEVLSRRR